MLPTSIKNCLLGDGTLTLKKTVASVLYMSTEKQSLELKRMLYERDFGEFTPQWSTGVSGYGGTKTIYRLRVPSILKTEFKELDSPDLMEQVLRDLDELDLFLWYLDDGSWHKSRNTMHLYSNMLDRYQSNTLIDRIGFLYGVKPRLRVDRKGDGREFYYLYFPRKLVNILHPIFKSYITAFGLSDFYYKVGGYGYEDIPVKNVKRVSQQDVKTIINSAESQRSLASRLGYSPSVVWRVRNYPEKYLSQN